MRAALIACLALVLLTPGAGAAPQRELTPTEKLERGRSSFRLKDFQSATPVLKDLLYPDVQLVRKDDVVEVHMLLGACYYELGNPEKATEEFTKALEIDVERGMTELNFSQGAIRLFDDTKAKIKDRIEAAAVRRALADRERQLREYMETFGVYETHSFGVNFIGFGFGQFQNGHKKKGVAIGVTQAVTGATSLGCFVYLATKYGLSARVPLEEGPGVRRLQQIEIGAGIAFFALYAYSVIDGALYYRPTARVRGDDSKIRLDLDLGRPQKPPARPKSTFRLGPILVPSGAGLGLSWESS
jgi:hypothetical protein